MALKKIYHSKKNWFKVGDYYCPDRSSIHSGCMHKDSISKSNMPMNKVELKRGCRGTGVISGRSINKGVPYNNKFYKPDGVGSWCWNSENNYCQCNCESYNDEKSCNSGYLKIDEMYCGSNCYCWGCHWS